MSDFQLGQRVRYAEHITRRYARPGEFDRGDKVWANDPWPGGKNSGGEGIIVGKRTLSEGQTHWIGSDEGTAYIPKKHFTAYVIAYDLRRKPVHVLPEHIEPLP